MAADAESASEQLEASAATDFAGDERTSASPAPYGTRGATGTQMVEASVKEEIPRRATNRATQVVIGRDGRRRLTNDMQVAPKGAGDWQD
jgi:hypothetical protein